MKLGLNPSLHQNWSSSSFSELGCKQPVYPDGKSGRAEKARQAYGIDTVNEFDPLFEDIYDYCDVQIDIDTKAMRLVRTDGDQFQSW